MSLKERVLNAPDVKSSSLRAQHGESMHYRPLDAIRVEGALAEGGTLKIVDGGGQIYGTWPVEGAFARRIRIGGELGWHRVVLEDGDGACMRQCRFWVDARTDIQTTEKAIEELWRCLHGSIARNRRTVRIDGEVVPYFIRWVRDDTHVQKAGVYWEDNTESWVERFIARQAASGMIYDYACGIESRKERVDVFGPRFHQIDPENGLRWERLPSEADVEYLLVENVYRGWQARGDDERIRRVLPKLEKALRYCMSDPLRWDPEKGLVKRPYTIDTWDFKFFGFTRDHLTDEAALQDAVFMVHPDTPMCIMHGDNTGLFQACTQLAKMFAALGEHEKALKWESEAERLRVRIRELCWNGEYYDHWVPVTPLGQDEGGIDGARSFTLSNAYNLNRGASSHEECASIIRKYQSLREELQETHFAEWLSAHPCWPRGFSGIAPGRYVNGGILTIVAGELARGSFTHGFESYGLDILRRLSGLLRENPHEPKRDPELFEQKYLFCGYTPDGVEMDGIPNAWGQAAVVAAIVEGIAGVRDLDRRFQRVSISPCWAAADTEAADVTIRYPASDGYVAYRYRIQAEQNAIILEVTGNAVDWEFALLLPEGRKAARVRRGERALEFQSKQSENGVYVCFSIAGRVCDVFTIELA